MQAEGGTGTRDTLRTVGAATSARVWEVVSVRAQLSVRSQLSLLITWKHTSRALEA